MIRFQKQVNDLLQAVLKGPGKAAGELRQQVAARAAALSGGDTTNTALPDNLDRWVSKVAQHAYKTTDEDVDALKGDYSQDEIFELTIAAAASAAHARFERAIVAIGDGTGED